MCICVCRCRCMMSLFRWNSLGVSRCCNINSIFQQNRMQNRQRNSYISIYLAITIFSTVASLLQYSTRNNQIECSYRKRHESKKKQEKCRHPSSMILWKWKHKCESHDLMKQNRKEKKNHFEQIESCEAIVQGNI